jgi:hypothetical protein
MEVTKVDKVKVVKEPKVSRAKKANKLTVIIEDSNGIIAPPVEVSVIEESKQ